WGALSHMVLPLGDMGIRMLPQEDAVLAGLKTNIPEPGLYIFPGLDMKNATPEAQAAWGEKYKSGPAGILVYRPIGGELVWPMLLAVEFLSTLLAAFLAAYIVSLMSASFGQKVLATMLMGVFGWLSLSVSYWNWYGFPTAYIASELIDQAVGWLLG